MRKAIQSTLRKVTLVLALGLGLAAPVFAVDGVTEINQVKALAGGVTAGDTAGFPVTLSESGSYRLTGNLTVSAVDTFAIEVETGGDDVTIDLNGFAVVGPGSGSATVTGINASANVDRTTLVNGSVEGFFTGIFISNSGHVENVRSTANGSKGIHVGGNSQILNCVSSGNNNSGILATGSVVVGNQANDNLATGIRCNQGCVIKGNVAHRNGNLGIRGFSSTIAENSAVDNMFQGISGSVGSVVIGNTVEGNGQQGITGTSGTLVKNNVARSNIGFGMSLDSTVGYSGNVMSSNVGGTVSSGVQIGTNLCNGSTTCP